MMTRKNSKFAQVKKYLAVPTFAVLALFFAEKTYAKENIQNSDQEKSNAISEIFSNPYIDVKQSEQIDEKTNNQDKNDKTEDFSHQSVSKDTIPVKKNVEANTAENKAQDIPAAVEENNTNITPAEYPGGINELRKKVSKNFNSAIFGETNGLVKSMITFVIDKNGSIRDLKAEGENEKFNNEVFRVTKEANENITWKPATKDGEPVAYRYNLPMAMQFTAYNKTQ